MTGIRSKRIINILHLFIKCHTHIYFITYVTYFLEEIVSQPNLSYIHSSILALLYTFQYPQYH